MFKEFHHQFGAKVSDELKQRYAQSPHWRNGKFDNLEETSMDIHFTDLPNLLYQQFCNKKDRSPVEALPVVPFDRQRFMALSETPQFIWYGHSVVLMRWRGKTILIDPMLGPNASPIAPFSTTRYSENTLDLIDEFPEIDLAMLTHDHYDHLDMASIHKLEGKVKQWFTALGVGRHLESWNIPSDSIEEFDWWDTATFEDIEITFTPSRHFSGRGMTDRARSLWGGWTFITNQFKLYWSGDGGYGDHFKEIGERFGSFDLGFIECGQYHEKWHQIHMYPEESVQAALDTNVSVAVPVHWGAFSLSLHSWTDPVDRFVAAANEHKLQHATPRLGQLFDVTDLNSSDWWK